MKKIININLSGRVIPIEDAAYEQLQAYIESLRKYFAHEDGRDEIINDIESRIAELLHDKVRKGSTAITNEDVEAVIASMGRVEDFEAQADESTESAQTGTQSNESNTRSKPRGRLYRDTNDRFIGGVCSGIASYLNVDPAIVRLIFAVISLGWGLGVLAYIILWIVLPPNDLDKYSGKRLYRNPDNNIIGGVAGGLAAYFNKKPSFFRLIFAAPLLINILFNVLSGFHWDNDFDFFMNVGIGSLTGTFILAYIILWIVIPEASGDYEKMEMRGETVDVNRIRQNVQAGMGTMKDRMKEWGDEVKDSAQNVSNKAREFANTRGKAFATEVQHTARRAGTGIGHAIGVIFKAFFLFVVGSIAFAMFIGLIALIFGGVAWWPINNFLWTSNAQQVFAWGTLIFFFVVPLIGFITWLVRRIMRVKSRSNYLGWTFGGLWLIGWIAGTMLAVSLAKDFREYEHTSTPVSLSQPSQGKMVVAVSQPELMFTGNFSWMGDGDEGWDLSSDTLKFSAIHFEVKASADTNYYVNLNRFSWGKTSDEALDRAADIQYEINSRDSILDLGPGYAIGKEKKFRGQNIEVEILVPIGKKIRFDESVTEKLNSVNVKIKKNSRRNRGVDIDIDNDHSFPYQTSIDYTMGVNGQLKSSEVIETKQPQNEYRYSDDTDSLLMEKRKKEKELEEINKT